MALAFSQLAGLEIGPGQRVRREDVVPIDARLLADGDRLVQPAAVLGEKARQPRRLRRVAAPGRFGQSILPLGGLGWPSLARGPPRTPGLRALASSRGSS